MNTHKYETKIRELNRNAYDVNYVHAWRRNKGSSGEKIAHTTSEINDTAKLNEQILLFLFLLECVILPKA